LKLSRFLLVTAILFFVFYDMVSTLAAASYLGGFDNEKNDLMRLAHNYGGDLGFIVLKTALGGAMIFLTYLLAEHVKGQYYAGVGILSGASLAGMFVGTSNFNILWSGHSFSILGLDAMSVSIGIIFACSIPGMLYGAIKKKNERPAVVQPA
jgi:hypothetical protein